MFPYRATFDYEVVFSMDDLPQTNTTDTTYIAQHVSMSVSIASNVEGYTEPQCFVSEGNAQNLVDSMIHYLESISDASYILLREQFQHVFEQLDDIEHVQKQTPDNLNIPVLYLRQRFDSYPP